MIERLGLNGWLGGAIIMKTEMKSLEYYWGLEYSINIIADPDGGYVAEFPDLPGCMTQGDSLEEVIGMSDEARELWLSCEYDRDPTDIPLPSYPVEYSGRFNVRIPKLLHQLLSDAAERDGVSLNQYVVALLARGEAEDRTLLQSAQAKALERERAQRQAKAAAV